MSRVALTVTQPSAVWGEEPSGAEVGVKTVHLDRHRNDSAGESQDIAQSDLLLLRAEEKWRPDHIQG